MFIFNGEPELKRTQKSKIVLGTVNNRFGLTGRKILCVFCLRLSFRNRFRFFFNQRKLSNHGVLMLQRQY